MQHWREASLRYNANLVLRKRSELHNVDNDDEESSDAHIASVTQISRRLARGVASSRFAHERPQFDQRLSKRWVACLPSLAANEG
jgi:hypothetical protein